MTRHPFAPQQAQQSRRATSLLLAALGMAAAALSWQTGHAWSAGQPVQPSTNQASSSAPGTHLPTVTIEAKQELERRVHRFVAAEVFQAPGESIMRWNKPICPFVAGLPRMFDDYIQSRIAEIARSANAPVGGKRCKTDFYVIASYDPELFLKKLWARVPEMYDTRSELGGVHRFLHSRDPVRVLFNSRLHCRVNSMEGGKSSDMMASFLGGGGTQVDTTSPYFCGGGGSRLSYSAVNSIQSALIIVDMNRMKEVTTRELADYGAMIGLADIRPDANAGDAPTILRLFQHPQHPPQGLSAWDRSLLYSIYNTSQSSVLQMPDMEKTVVARIEHQGDPDQISSRSSGSPSPLWANEVMPQRDTDVIGWYRAAAQHGDADSQYALGVMYDRGQGVQQNYTTAAGWYGRAAEQGDDCGSRQEIGSGAPSRRPAYLRHLSLGNRCPTRQRENPALCTPSRLGAKGPCPGRHRPPPYRRRVSRREHSPARATSRRSRRPLPDCRCPHQGPRSRHARQSHHRLRQCRSRSGIGIVTGNWGVTESKAGHLTFERRVPR